jgi:signal transduction histidine kinase
LPPGFTGQWQGEKRDYRGIPVFGVWQAVRWDGFAGIVASEIDVAEVFQPIQKIWTFLLIFQAVSAIFIVLSGGFLANWLSWKTEREAELQTVRRQSLIEGQTRERNWIGLELHDDISQEVAALNWRLATYNLAPELFEPLSHSIQRILQKIRTLSHGLQSNVISASGLPDSVRNLISESGAAATAKGLAIDLVIDGDPADYQRLESRFTFGAYRILQEGIHNIFKHSGASKAQIHLSLNPQSGLKISITDNGKGVKDASSVSGGGLGLRNMQSRAEALQGKIKTESPPEGGFRVHAIFKENLFT